MALLKLLITKFTPLLVFLLTSETNAQNFQSPCPRLFTYDTTTNETDTWYGTLTLLSESDLLDVWLRLTFDREALQLGNWFGQVETSDSKEYHIRKNNHELKANVPHKFRFFLKYNSNAPAPRLFSFRLNGKLVCSADTLLDTTSPNKVNTQSDTSNLDTITFPANTNRLKPDFQNGVNSQISTNSRDKLDTQLNTNSQNFDTNVRDGTNPQLDTNLQNKLGVSREKVPPQLDPQDKVNTQFVINSQSGSNTNSRVRINTQLSSQQSTNLRDKVNTNAGDSVSTNSRDRVTTQFVPNSQNTLGSKEQDRNNQLDINSDRKRVNPQLNLNLRDRINTQMNSNSQDRLNTQPGNSSSSRDNQGGTNSQDTSTSTIQNNALHDDICGTVLPQPRPLIAYGEISHDGEFPWHAALHLARSIKLTYICGASLISTNYVVTAAHCVIMKKPQESLKPEELIVQLGKYNLKRFSVGYQDRLVSMIVPHPQFSAETYLNDIALLKLTTPANITEFVRPVCLWQESTDIIAVLNKIGRVVGWGYDETGKISEELMQAKMPVVAKDRCISSYPDFYSRFTSANSFCAGFANGTSPCNGDAGDGMVFPTSNSNRYNPVWQLRGLVSVLPIFKNQILCDVTHYTIFTDVAKYLDWIQASMK